MSQLPLTPKHGRSTATDNLFTRRERRILVLYVGGTIGMKKNSSDALEPCAGYLTQEMRNMHELKEGSEIAPFDIIEYEVLLDSSDMNANDYLRIARDVETHYDDYAGFLIAHGTDTMHYTASALSFLLFNLAKPVIITGAMVALAEPYNDARRNLVIGMMIASNPKICEVCIFFNDSLFRGNRCDKVFHTYGAFQSLNYPPLGVMEATNFVLLEQNLLPQPTGAMSIMSDLRGRVMSFHLHPDADVETIIRLLEAKTSCPRVDNMDAAPHPNHSSGSVAGVDGVGQKLLDGIVLTLNGVGCLTGSFAKVLHRIGETAKKLNIVVVALQREGRGVFTAKEVLRMQSICPWVVYVRDMVASTAEVKLMYLFGKGMRPEQVANAVTANLRGEITPPLESHF